MPKIDLANACSRVSVVDGRRAHFFARAIALQMLQHSLSITAMAFSA